MTLGPVSTDALNRSGSAAYGAVTGVTQTVRNFGGSLGLAVLGSVLVTTTTAKVERSLPRLGVPRSAADRIAQAVTSASSGAGSGHTGGSPHRALPAGAGHALAVDFASGTRTVVIAMAAAMAVAFVVAVLGMPRGRGGQEAAGRAGLRSRRLSRHSRSAQAQNACSSQSPKRR